MKGSNGNKFLAINLLVNASATSTANAASTLCMRYAEIKKGITVFKDPELQIEAGVSKECAKQAVVLTSFSRGALGSVCMVVPISLMMMLNLFSIKPVGHMSKFSLQIATLAMGLYIGLPISVALCPTVLSANGQDIEPEFNSNELVYFYRGK